MAKKILKLTIPLENYDTFVFMMGICKAGFPDWKVKRLVKTIEEEL